jgi:DNA polymerase
MARTDEGVEPDRPGAQEWLPTVRRIESLRDAAQDCRGCELWEPATQVVFSSGSSDARVVMVGEQPGDVEDKEGEPFVGPAGKLLRRAIEDAGLALEDVYLTNAVKHFRFTSRGKRRIHEKPNLAQLVACRPWLEAEVETVDPDLVVVLGATAARSILGPGVKVTKQRGQLLHREAADGGRVFLPTVHPSSVLRAREKRNQAYDAFVADLRVAGSVL